MDQARARRYSRRAGQRFDSLTALDRAAAIARDLKLPAERLDPLRDEAIACLALPDLRPDPGIRKIRRPAGVISVAFDCTMTRYAFRFRDGTIQVHRVADHQEVARFHVRGDREAVVFRFSPDGRYLVANHYPDYGVTVWDLERAPSQSTTRELVMGGGQVQPRQPPDRRRPSRWGKSSSTIWRRVSPGGGGECRV